MTGIEVEPLIIEIVNARFSTLTFLALTEQLYFSFVQKIL